MDRRSFEELLDESLLVFRQQLLESFPASAELELPTDSGRQEDIEEPAAENPGGGTESLSVRRPDFQIQELESFELNLEHATGTNSVPSMWRLGQHGNCSRTRAHHALRITELTALRWFEQQPRPRRC